MITGNQSFKADRAAVWNGIKHSRARMDQLSSNWTNPANVKKWAEFKSILDEFEIAQAKVEAVAKTADEQQGAATKEIAVNTEQVASGTQEVSASILEVNDAVKDTGRHSSEVLQAAGELTKLSSVLRSEVDSFLNDIKAA